MSAVLHLKCKVYSLLWFIFYLLFLLLSPINGLADGSWLLPHMLAMFLVV